MTFTPVLARAPRRFLHAALLWFLFPAEEAVAQIPPDLSVRRLEISVTDPRPVAGAILEIERRHGVAISYEDPPLVYADDIQDVAAQVSRRLAEFAARGETPPPVLVPKGGTVRFSYETERSTVVPVNVTVERLLAEVLQSHVDAGNAGTFRIAPGRGMTHVIPVSARDATGAVSAVTPVLDAVIDVSLENTDGRQALRAVCEAVSRASGQTVALAEGISFNLFRTTPISIEDARGVAREILVDILSQFRVRLSWSLLYGPGQPQYVLNIHRID